MKNYNNLDWSAGTYIFNYQVETSEKFIPIKTNTLTLPSSNSIIYQTCLHDAAMNPQSVPSSPYLAKFETKFIDMFKWDSESNQIFYSENTFSFAGTWSLYCYLYMIGEEKRMCIGHIYFRFSGLQRVDAFKLLGECKSLRTLKIGVEQDTMSGSKKTKVGSNDGQRDFYIEKNKRDGRCGGRCGGDTYPIQTRLHVPLHKIVGRAFKRSIFQAGNGSRIYKDVDRGDELERGDSRAGSDPGRTVGRGRGYAVRTKVQESQASPRFHNS